MPAEIRETQATPPTSRRSTGAFRPTPEIEGELSAIAQSESCELAHVEAKGGVLRIVLDHPTGVTIENCARVSKQVSALLDRDDFGSGRYLLEVTSPGLDRQLYGPRDYQRFVGRAIRVTRVAGTERRKTTVVGRLAAFVAEDGGGAEDGEGGRENHGGRSDCGFAVVLDAGGAEHRIPLSEITVARLEIEL